MNTQLIYVSKEKAEVQDPLTGSFFNQVSQGIAVKQGDQVSIEGIAINSVGVGADIIEVPRTTQGYAYYPNKMQLNTWLYIHNNYDYAIPLPLENPVIYPTGIVGTAEVNNYGWLNNSGVPVVSFETMKQAAGGGSKDFYIGGKRMYVGRYSLYIDKVQSDVNYQDYDFQNPDPQAGNPGTLLINIPGGASGAMATGANARVWCPLRSDMSLSVTAGYDNPSNIANKISADFQNADVIPHQNLMPYGTNAVGTGVSGTTESYLQTNNIIQPVAPRINQLTCSSKNSASILIRAIPSTEPTWNTDPTTQNANYTSWLACANPFLHYYGSRLLTDFSVKHNTFCNARAAIKAFQTQNGEIINLYTADDDGAGTATWQNGYVFTTNLAYNEDNLKMVRDLLHSQKYRPSGSPDTTTEGLKGEQRGSFQSVMSIGRNDDSAPLFTQPLPPKSTLAGLTYCGVSNQQCKTFYDKIYYSSHYLGQEAQTHAGVRIANDNSILFEGQIQFPQTIAQRIDANLCCVDTGTSGNNEMNIGIIMLPGEGSGATPATALLGSGLMSFNNPILVNLQYKNPNNLTAIVINPHVLKGDLGTNPGAQAGMTNVGSPNMNMVFDATRGRFAMANMSWPVYTQATTAGDAGGSQIIIANTAKTNFGSSVNEMFLSYGQAGIGIVDLSVKSLATDEWEKIDQRNAEDIDNKYGGCLWNRLGFVYEDFINSYGQPDAIFTERHHNSAIPLPFATSFPYPLTNNSAFATSLNISLFNGTAATNLPQYGLNTSSNQPNISITAETALTYASNLPQKLEFPYWLIQSDLIEGCQFNSENNGSEDNIMALCNRAYLAGDFAFSFAPDYKFTATKDFVVTGIKTRILNPDLSPAFINDKTAIIYKIESPIQLFSLAAKLPPASLVVPKGLVNGNDALLPLEAL